MSIKNYVVLDIETSCRRRSSICAISVLEIRNGEIIDKKYTLLDPEDDFEQKNTDINGIKKSDIVGKPTFESFWPQIEDQLRDNIIVGHNVNNFDLSSLSKALMKYSIEIPQFRYFDTQKFFETELGEKDKGCSLDTLCSRHLNYSFNHHDAYEDTVATFKLFEWIKVNYNINECNIRNYEIKPPKDELSDEIIKNINLLDGCLEGILSDNIINGKEFSYIRDWMMNNRKHNDVRLVNDINRDILQTLISGSVTTDDIKIMFSLTHQCPTKGRNLSEYSCLLLRLEGLVRGICCDGDINNYEILRLRNWIGKHPELGDESICVEVKEAIRNIDTVDSLNKKGIDDLRSDLLSVFSVQLTEQTNIVFNGKSFLLSGNFSLGKSKTEELLHNKGAVIKKSSVKSLNYYVQGSKNSGYKHDEYGGKYDKVIEFNSKGADIKIITEEQLLEALGIY